ncbi:proteinral secretion pathway protein h [Leptolyngbya sp. Heron Island J]|uniref:type IV pilin protein n=1 Tax=Leptolyngbya sp. Heron Island J TaxID=1385935 RepID=UPI0003B94349|nr:type IV pilin-like G/H family protein [Leptolyngbya sp. Heron Island J]ESA38850.1 proteinral secretion pathway protein h [Leptolyngbya sp. Heron Island J]
MLIFTGKAFYSFKKSMRSGKLKSKNTYGFTILETLIAIVIVGILSAISLPVFMKQVNNARETEAQIAVNFLKKSQYMFYLENNSFSDDLQELDFYETETENYIYLAQTDGNLDGMVHIAMSKRKEIDSYASVVYLEGNQLAECSFFSMDISFEDSIFEIMRFVSRVVEDYEQYCTA